ncbi:Toll/interleukin-1 receptor domain-containing protein [Tanacetum coccineum]
MISWCVRMIGIWGMGGGGKTTLAKAVFNRICVRFDGKAFVQNVREVSESSLNKLQEQILSSVLSKANIDVRSEHVRACRQPVIECGSNVSLGVRMHFKEIFRIEGYADLSRQRCWQIDDAIRALESCGFYARNGLRVLEQRSLINISEDGYLGMHDHLEEMGMNIVRRVNLKKPETHSRLWIKEEIIDILANNLATPATQCIKLDVRGFNFEISMNDLANMKELRFLHVKFASAGMERWYSKIVQLCKGGKEKIPAECPKLVTLLLSNCIQVAELPEGIGRLECLKELDITGTCIRNLPESIFRRKGLRIVGSRRILEYFLPSLLLQKVINIWFSKQEDSPCPAGGAPVVLVVITSGLCYGYFGYDE